MPQPAARDRFFDLLRASISDGSLSKLTLGKHRGEDPSLENIFIRPVLLKGGSQLSFLYRHKTRDITKNYPPADALALLEKLIGSDGDFLDAHLFTATQTAQLTCDAEGKSRIHLKRTIPATPPAATASASTASVAHSVAPLFASHDRTRQYAVPATAPWLQSLGIMTQRAQPRDGDMAAKFRQINKFTELLTHLAVEAKLIEAPQIIPVPLSEPAENQAPDKTVEAPASAFSRDSSALRVADMGCGKGYLTFATAALFGARANVQGIETRPELVALCNRIARENNFTNLTFTQGNIHDTALTENALDALIALHACDTATDDAIAKGINAGARLIVVSPCCQKELRPQLTAPPVLAEALRHGIFQERQAEFVTDALRAQLLEYAGYRTKVFEFISTEHTAKNLMIAAIKTRPPGDATIAKHLREFARFYGIRRHALAKHLDVELA